MSDATHEDREYVVIDGAKYYRTEGITAIGWMDMLVRAGRPVPLDVRLDARDEAAALGIRPEHVVDYVSGSMTGALISPPIASLEGADLEEFISKYRRP